MAFLRFSSAVLVQTKGWQRSFQPSTKERILALRSLTEANVPPRMACFWMIPNQTSTRLSHDPEVGVKCTWIRGFPASQASS